ncbi:MAG: PIN domain-containing protein [Acidobacteriota bacterium]|nr:PIN domain-containing protein [Acidobacteriota bacterium]
MTFRSPSNALAAQVIKSSRMQGAMFVTTNYIIAELVALLHSPMRISRHESIRFIDSLKSAPYVEIVHINETLDAAAWQLLKARADKNWSLADCASFALMQQRNMTDAFTTDHHFEQAGFTRLLK